MIFKSSVAVDYLKHENRLMEPQLKPRGVTIQTDIEYREGPYFVLAVNIVDVDWLLLMKWVAERDFVAALSHTIKEKQEKKTLRQFVQAFLARLRLRFPSRDEVVAWFLVLLHRRVPAVIAVSILRICYMLFMSYAVNKFILSSISSGKSDASIVVLGPVIIKCSPQHLLLYIDIFRYVERKGMEMQVSFRFSTCHLSFFD